MYIYIFFFCNYYISYMYFGLSSFHAPFPNISLKPNPPAKTLVQGALQRTEELTTENSSVSRISYWTWVYFKIFTLLTYKKTQVSLSVKRTQALETQGPKASETAMWRAAR